MSISSDAKSASETESSRKPLVDDISADDVEPITAQPGNASRTATTSDGSKLSNAAGMSGQGPNPIWAETVRLAFSADQEAAIQHDADVEQSELDKQELRELERTELYGETSRAKQPSRLRSVLDRLLRRSS